MTRAGIFGWSLPPGCSVRDIDPPEPPCSVCGKQVDSKTDPCTCPPCTHKECGECGCIKHIPLKDFLATMDRLTFQLGEYNREYKRRQEKMAYTCLCGERITPDLIREDADYCHKCKKNVYRDKNGVVHLEEEY